MLKFKYATKEEIPSEYVALYSEVNGAWVLTGVSGIKTQEDVDRVQEALRKEREDHKETKTKLQEYSAIGDPEEVQQKLDRIEELEAAAKDKIDDAKLNEMVETRLKAREAPLNRQIAKLTEENNTLKGEVTTFKQNETKRTIHDVVREECVKAKMLPSAIEDALLFSDRLFELDANGKPVTKDNAGVIPGLEPGAWLVEIKNSKPHWWPESKGTGAGGGSGSGGVGNNPFSHEHWNLTEQGNLVKNDRAKAEQLAKAAGTTIGGGRPVAPVKK